MHILKSLILITLVLSGFTASEAHAGIFTGGGILARTCEGLLMEISDRRIYVSSKPDSSEDFEVSKIRLKEGIESWIKNTQKYLPDATDNKKTLLWGNFLISKTLGRWSNLIRQNLIQQKLLKGEINRDNPEWTFFLERETLFNLYPEIQNFQAPADYQFAIAPSFWLNNWDASAMTDSVRKIIYLPASVLWKLSDEDKISVLHEVIHARLEQGRRDGNVSLFPFLFHFEGDLRKRLEHELDSYAHTVFSGEEVAARLITFAYRLDQHCKANYDGNFHESAHMDGVGIYKYSSSYARDVLPQVIAHLRLTSHPKFTENENGYMLEMDDPELQPLLDAQSFKTYYGGKPKRGATSLDRVLINEKSWVMQARHVMMPVLREAHDMHTKKKPMNWKNYCGYSKTLWAHANLLGLDLQSLRLKK